jgi:hypothetical protein
MSVRQYEIITGFQTLCYMVSARMELEYRNITAEKQP